MKNKNNKKIYKVSYENIVELLNRGLITDELKEQLHYEFDWGRISWSKNLSEDFMREFQDKLNWDDISRHQKLSEDFMREFKNKVNWHLISIYQKLSEDFMIEFAESLDWNCISKYQKLSEDFMREFLVLLNRKDISKYQKLSEDFMIEFAESLDWNCISKYQNTQLTESQINENKQMIMKTNNFECYDDYFIGWKAIRVDRYSKFNFQYKYEVGNVYTAHADFTSEKNSFGLSIGSEEFAKYYTDDEMRDVIIRVKCYYKDVARIVHDGEKVRATKIEILD